LAPPPAPTVSSRLEDCSPFSSFDGRHEREFDGAKGTVIQTEDVVEEGVGIPDPHQPQSTGTFTTDDSTMRVRVEMPGSVEEYELVSPVGSDTCILAVGDSASADLRNSWISEEQPETSPDRPEGDE
jgi:hypothetical protein